MCPDGVFVVGCLVFEAAVEDADQAVGEGSQGMVVEVAGCSSSVVEHSGTPAVG